MNARIREKINRARSGPPVVDRQISLHEEYFTAVEVGRRLKLHKDTIKDLMRKETMGVIRIGNARTLERYSASAIERLVRRLERGEDPRFS